MVVEPLHGQSTVYSRQLRVILCVFNRDRQTTCSSHHGLDIRLGHDVSHGGSARAVPDPIRERNRLRAPHAGVDGRVRARRRGARHPGDHRRRRRRRSPARHGRLAHGAAGARRAGAERVAAGTRLAAVDRADAGRRAGRHARDRQTRRDQRRAARRRHSGPTRPELRERLREFRAEQSAKVRQDALP